MGTRVPCRYKKGNPYTYPIVPLPQPLGGNPYPCQSLRTPHEMLKGEMPNIDHLHVFGCGAFVYLPATARANKMAPKLELMTYVGAALAMSATSCLCAPPMQCLLLHMPSLMSVISLAAPKTGTNLLRTLSEGQIRNQPLIAQGIPLMITTVMMMWNMTMATHIPKHRMTIQSARNQRLLRKSLLNQILPVCHLQCLHQHRECLHWQEIHHLQHHSIMAEQNAARMRCDPLQ